MKMDLCSYFVVFTMFLKMSSSIRCYKCRPLHSDYKRGETCEHFDYSAKYIVNCEHSTMCYKREITSELGNGVKLFERDCAKQLLNGDQKRTETGWKPVKRIYEVYEEGCVESPQRTDMVTRTTNCYCRGDLCNGVSPINKSVLLFLVAILAIHLF